MILATPLLCIALAVGVAPIGQAQEPVPAMGNRGLSFVASAPEARFYSHFWLNPSRSIGSRTSTAGWGWKRLP